MDGLKKDRGLQSSISNHRVLACVVSAEELLHRPARFPLTHSIHMMRFFSCRLRGVPLVLAGLCVVGGAILGCRTANDREIFVKALNSQIPDVERRAEIEAVFRRRGEHQDAFLNEVEAIRDRLQNAISNVHSKPNQGSAIQADFDAAWVAMRDEVIDGSMELRRLMSAEIIEVVTWNTSTESWTIFHFTTPL